ncbi:MAG: inositol monophosphatase [Microthrixaceae bacterium]
MTEPNSSNLHPEEALDLLDQVAIDVRIAVAEVVDPRARSERPGQYALDLAADGGAVATLTAAGLGVLSEESGHHHPQRPLQVVLDPVDGSTNASRGLPWWATSACIMDADGPWVSLVRNQATGATYTAVRGGGAELDGRPLDRAVVPPMKHSMVAINGTPSSHLGWKQFRSLGAAALDICAVADGRLDLYLDATLSGNAPWDFLGGLLVLTEVGGVMLDAHDRTIDGIDPPERRQPVAARSRAAAEEARDRAHSAGWWQHEAGWGR